MQVTNAWKIQNTTAKFLEYDIIFTRSISSLTTVETKPIQCAKKKISGANEINFQGDSKRMVIFKAILKYLLKWSFSAQK